MTPNDITRKALEALGVFGLSYLERLARQPMKLKRPAPYRGREYTAIGFDEASAVSETSMTILRGQCAGKTWCMRQALEDALIKGLGTYMLKPLDLNRNLVEIYQSTESEAFYGRIKETSNPSWLDEGWLTIDEQTPIDPSPWPFPKAPPVPHVMGLDPEVIDQDAYAAFMKSL